MRKRTEEKKSYAATSLVVPLSVSLAVLIVTIIFLILNVNVATNNLADIMKNSVNCQQTATKLQAGSSILSETATSFVQSPIVPQGEEGFGVNSGPISAYAREMMIDRRGPEIAEQFRSLGVGEEVQDYIDAAAEYSEEMRKIQLHAISLIASAYPLPKEPLYEVIPLIELTINEKAMPVDARMAVARSLLINREYSTLKFYLNENVEKSHKALEQQFDDISANTNRHIKILRIVLWAVIFLISLSIAAAIIIFYRWIIRPLNKCAEDMSSDRKASENGRITEFRSMVTAFNGLLDRRGELEDILRSAAETDPLTGLPNRYHYEQSILELDKKDGSIGLLVFDVDFLKEANDNEGHTAGDRLLRKAAEVIAECFGTDGAANCYRIGGDEFAAILRGCDEAEVKKRIESFEQATKRENISVSVGYAFDKVTDEKTFRLLVGKADKSMYENKKLHHQNMQKA